MVCPHHGPRCAPCSNRRFLFPVVAPLHGNLLFGAFLRSFCRNRNFRLHRMRVLVFAQSFETGLTQQTIAREGGKFDFGHQFRLDPFYVFRARRFLAAREGRAVAPQPVQGFQKRRHVARIEAGTDAAAIDEFVAIEGADLDRAQCFRVAPPAADDDFLAAAAFRFGPEIAAARAIGRVQALRHDAFQSRLAGGVDHGLTQRLEMIDVAKMCAALALDEHLQQRLAFGQGLMA